MCCAKVQVGDRPLTRCCTAAHRREAPTSTQAQHRTQHTTRRGATAFGQAAPAHAAASHGVAHQHVGAQAQQRGEGGAAHHRCTPRRDAGCCHPRHALRCNPGQGCDAGTVPDARLGQRHGAAHPCSSRPGERPPQQVRAEADAAVRRGWQPSRPRRRPVAHVRRRLHRVHVPVPTVRRGVAQDPPQHGRPNGSKGSGFQRARIR